MENIDKVVDYINVQRDRYVDELKQYLAIPSISALPQHAADVKRCAEWSADEMRRIAGEIEFHPAKHRQLLLDWIDTVTIDWPISRRRWYHTEIPLWLLRGAQGVLVTAVGRKAFEQALGMVSRGGTVVRRERLVELGLLESLDGGLNPDPELVASAKLGAGDQSNTAKNRGSSEIKQGKLKDAVGPLEVAVAKHVDIESRTSSNCSNIGAVSVVVPDDLGQNQIVPFEDAKPQLVE